MKKRTILLLAGLAVGLVALFSLTAKRIYELVVARRAVEAQLLQGEAARETRQAPLFEVAPVAVPSAVPYMQSSPDGGTSLVVDRAALRSLLLHEKYDALDAAFEAYQAAFEANQSNESAPLDAGDAFAVAEAPLTALLDRWVAATPTHFAPYLARGGNHVALASARRGGEYARDTPVADMAEMNATLPKALADLDRALELRPSLIAAHRQKLVALRFWGKHREGRAVFDQARASCPQCLRVAVTWIFSLTPRWGGSYEAMQAFADEQTKRAVPNAKVLGGFPDLDRASLAGLAHDDAAASIAVERTFAFGEHAEFYEERARIAERQKRMPAALADVDRALVLAPQHPELEVIRARILAAMREWELAGQQLLRTLRVDANAHGARSLRDSIVENLVYQAWEADKAGDRVRALRFLELALELSPGNADADRRRAWILSGGQSASADAGSSPPVVVEADAEFRAAQQQDYALARQGRFAEILPIWERYLRAHPDDARAYFERGGTYQHLGRRAEAHADAQRACELGMNQGCVYARRTQP